MHREAYVASLMFLSERKVFTALMSPRVPMEMRSSMFTPAVGGLSYRLAMKATNRRFRSMRVCRAASEPSPPDSSTAMISASSSRDRGWGSTSGPWM